MPYEKNLFAVAEERNNLSGEFIYGSSMRDLVFLVGRYEFRRFAPLTRKALRYYAKDAYDQHTIEKTKEFELREYIARIIEAKVKYKLSYDWEFLDNFFKMTIGELLEIDIPYDAERLKYVNPEAQIPEHLWNAS